MLRGVKGEGKGGYEGGGDGEGRRGVGYLQKGCGVEWSGVYK